MDGGMEYQKHPNDDSGDECVDEGSALLQDHSVASSSQNLLRNIATMQPERKSQTLTAIAASFGAMSMGAVIGFSSPAGPIFLNGNDGFNLTSRQNDWVSSSVTIGALVGCPLAGICMAIIGRKLTMLSSCIPYMAGWALIVGGQNFSMLLIGRLICGLCMGFSSVTVPTYIGEIASTDIRGTLASLFQLMVTIGILYAYTMGPVFDSFRLIGLVCAIPVVIYAVGILFCRESPLFLLMNNKRNEAVEALQFLRGRKYDIRKETQAMVDSIEEAKRNKISLAEMKQPYIIKSFIIAIMLMVFQQLSGINAVLFNLSIIFQEAGTIGDDISAIIIGLVMVIFTIVSTFLIDKLGRRLLLQISSFFMAASLVALGVFFYYKETADSLEEGQAILDKIGWLPITAMVCFITAFSIGYGPIPWIMMSEMFFPNVKELAASVATFSNWLFAFITTITFGMLRDTIGSYGVYWMYAGICTANFVFCCVVVPETKGRTTEEITASFGRQRTLLSPNDDEHSRI